MTVATQPLRPGPATEADRPWRAAVLTALGGLLTVVVSVGMRRTGVIAFGVGDAGTIVGGLSLLLGLFMLARPDQTLVFGGLAVLAGVVSFPMSLGGLVVGAVLTVLGGALGAAWSPAPEDAVLEVRPAPAPRRLAALVIDALLAGGLAVASSATVLHGATTAAAWLFWPLLGLAWLVVVLPATLLLGVTPGKWLTRLSVVGASDASASRRDLVAREGLRVAVLVAVSVLLVTLLSTGPVLVAAVAVVLLGAAGALLHVDVAPHDRLAGSAVVRRQVVLPATST